MTITPDCNTILKLAEKYSIVPVCREIYADVTTPITLLRKLTGFRKDTIFWRVSRAGRLGEDIPFWDMTRSCG